ncbi:MAG: two-component system response regulator MnoR [Pyrinomonadaceae bacterium]
MVKTTRRIRVILVDDHAIIRSGLRAVFSKQPQIEIIGEAATGGAALALTAKSKPDVVLLDLDLGDGDESGALIPQLHAVASDARILILTGIGDKKAHVRALKMGASGLVTKDKATETIVKAVEKVYQGEVWFDRAMMSAALGEMMRPSVPSKVDPESAKINSLTGREREVIRLIGEGLKNKQIADQLFISETTVTHHLTSVFSKLDVKNRLELIIYAYRYKLARPPE